MKTAYFAGGCFWCITPVFSSADGVLSVTAGYCGGEEANPTYEDVKHQKTRHRETIRIEYEEEKTGYRKLMELFLKNVDPFDAGGQYIDRGFSYTLAVYYESPEEKVIAESCLKTLEKVSGRKPCVSLEKYLKFYEAEEYHQNFYLKNPEAFAKEMEESGRR